MAHLEILAIEGRLKEVERLMESLEEEASDLNIALRVLRKYSKESPSDPSPTNEVSDVVKEAKLGPPRPEGIPTSFEMTEMVLRSAEREGKSGLTANEIVELIGQRYWPGVVGAQILPIIYQFAKRGRIHKTASGKFKTVRGKGETIPDRGALENEAPSNAVGAS